MNKAFGASLTALSLLVGTLFAENSNEKGKDVDLKIRFVNSTELMRDTEEGKKISKELQGIYKKLAEEVQELNKKLETSAAEYKKRESMLSESAKESEQKKLSRMKRELDVKAQEAEEEYKSEAQKATERISKEIIEVAEEVAKADELDALIDKDSGRALYVADEINYTSKLSERMNKKSAIEESKKSA